MAIQVALKITIAAHLTRLVRSNRADGAKISFEAIAKEEHFARLVLALSIEFKVEVARLVDLFQK